MSDVALASLVIDNTSDGLFRVNRRVFTDPHILELEHQRVFEHSWIYAGHESVEMLESCQRGFANREVAWSDISRGMRRAQPLANDELQMRAFWRKWHELMTRSRPAEAMDRPAIAVS